MHRYKIPLFFIATLVYISPAFASAPELNCEYASKFEECYDANQSGTARSITDFVCLERSGNWEQVLTQIVLDVKFQETDKEVEEYLKKLEDAKGEYFGADNQSTPLRGVDDIYKQFTEYGYYGKKLTSLCETGIIQEIVKCGDEIQVTEAQQFLGGTESSVCKTLALSKLDIYREVAINVLHINKIEVRKDERKEFVQKQRGKYGELLEIIRTLIGDLERMMNGWPTKTRDTVWHITERLIKILS